MPQLPITPATPQSSGASAGKSSASSASSDGGAGLEGAQGQNFGEVLTKQIKGSPRASASDGNDSSGKTDAPALSPVDFSMLVASAPAVPAQAVGMVPLNAVPAGVDPGKALTRSHNADESGKPEEKSDASAIPQADLSTLASLPFVPAAPVRIESSAAKVPAEVVPDQASVRSLRAGEIQLAAKTAGSDKDLPVAISPQKEFSDKLAAMADAPVNKAGIQSAATDLSAGTQISAAGGVGAGALQQQERTSALSVAAKVGSAEWGGAVGEKVLWMANQNRQVAELHLNPPNLGPLEVRLTINSDQASAMFVSHHAAVREAIEAALPRLREMLADNGIMLGNTTVGSESFNQQQAFNQHDGSGGRARADAGMEGVLARISGSGRPAGQAHDGMVDIFA